MQQAEPSVTQKIPHNVLVADHPGDTLNACVSVLALLMDIKDTRQEVKGLAPLREAAEEGVSRIEMLVLDAISYEARRA